MMSASRCCSRPPKVVALSLWEAVAGDAAELFAAGMGANQQKVWTWKDELVKAGFATSTGDRYLARPAGTR